MSRLDGPVAEPSITVVGDAQDSLFLGITPFDGAKLGGAFGTGSGPVTFSIAGAGIEITEFANNTLSRDFSETYAYDVEPIVRQAFADFAAAGNVDFVQVADDGVAGVETSVAYARYFHGEPQRAGNYGGVYLPQEGARGGNAMIADAQITRGAVNFGDTVLHQVGHIVGLGQTDDPSSVMLPSVFSGAPGLGPGDIEATRLIYGEQDRAPIVYRLANGQAEVDAVYATDLLVIEGNALDNSIAATEADDTLNGGGGDDRLEGRGGNDAINGGEGTDAAVFRGLAADYAIEGDATAATIRGPDGEDRLTGIEQLIFDDRMVDLETTALTPAEARAVAYLYEVGLDRDGDIDLGGLNFWIDEREAGLSEAALAAFFLASDEFAGAFGDPDQLSDQALVETLYRNVLDRAGEPDGVAFWTDLLGQDDFSRARLLIEFAGSVENVETLAFIETLTETAPGEWSFIA